VKSEEFNHYIDWSQVIVGQVWIAHLRPSSSLNTPVIFSRTPSARVGARSQSVRRLKYCLFSLFLLFPFQLFLLSPLPCQTILFHLPFKVSRNEAAYLDLRLSASGVQDSRVTPSAWQVFLRCSVAFDIWTAHGSLRNGCEHNECGGVPRWRNCQLAGRMADVADGVTLSDSDADEMWQWTPPPRTKALTRLCRRSDSENIGAVASREVWRNGHFDDGGGMAWHMQPWSQSKVEATEKQCVPVHLYDYHTPRFPQLAPFLGLVRAYGRLTEYITFACYIRTKISIFNKWMSLTWWQCPLPTVYGRLGDKTFGRHAIGSLNDRRRHIWATKNEALRLEQPQSDGRESDYQYLVASGRI